MYRQQLAALLTERGIGRSRLGRGKFEKLFRQLEQGELAISVATALSGVPAGALVLDGDVSATRIYCDSPSHGQRETLVEYKFERGGLVPRIKNRGSVSGGIRGGETPLTALRRELLEELSVEPPDRCFIEPRFHLEEEPELYGPALSSRYPGFWSRKRVFHSIWVMPLEYYQRFYLEFERPGSKTVKSAFSWWPMAFWDFNVPPQPARSLPELLR
jgi:8-oxo-dGTP pyrophosphatase MutT (NUDIX family)